jgi:hypothetical protein
MLYCACKRVKTVICGSTFVAVPIVNSDQHKTPFAGPDAAVYVWTEAPHHSTRPQLSKR